MRLLIDVVRNGRTENEENWPSELGKYKRVRDSLHEKNSIALYKGRIIISRSICFAVKP